jgi:hypothetical protein
MANIRNNYVHMINADLWRLQLQDAGMKLSSAPMQSTMSGAVNTDHSEVHWETGMPGIDGDLPPLVYGHLQDIWAIYNPVYNALRNRFRAEDKALRARKRSRRPALPPQITPNWVPRTGPTLTAEQKRMTAMTASVTHWQRVTLNRKHHFRTEQSQEKNKNNDSAFKIWYDDAVVPGRRTAAFGWIQSIFEHSLGPGGETMTFIHADWADVMEEMGSTGLTQVRWDPQSNFNLTSSVTTVSDLVPYNIAMLHQRITDLHNDRCDVYAVIDPQFRLGKWVPTK